MIDEEKWADATKKEKMDAIKAIKAIANENTLTKADNALITDFLLEEALKNE